MRLRVSVTLEPDQSDYDSQRTTGGYIGGNLQLSQQFELESVGFLDACRFLGQFDDLAKKIATEKGKKQ